METLENIINTGDPREIKRALSVKMCLSGIKPSQISEILGISEKFVSKWKLIYQSDGADALLLGINEKFVSKWKLIYQSDGADALLLGYKGSQSLLSPQERKEVISYLSGHRSILFENVVEYIESTYGVVYQSKQSYYDLLKESRLSWHKTHKANPKKNTELIVAKREEIKKN